MNNYFLKGKLNFLLDGNAGSSGKGKISDYLVEKEDVNFLVTSNSANASHTVVRDGKEYIFKALPSGSLHHEKLDFVFIADNASFELKSLLDEIGMSGIPLSKVKISPRAGIIMQIDKDYEAGLCDLNGKYEGTHEGTIKTGTTASGSGSVLAKKTLRNKTLVTAGDVPELKDMLCDVSDTILKELDKNKTGFFEIGQGFPLSNNHLLFAPHTTSRNVTVSSALNDSFLPPSVCGNVIINFRTFPIKIHSFKYKALEDFTFEYVGLTKNELLKKHTLFNPPIFDDKGDSKVIIKKGDFLSWFEKSIIPHELIDSPSGEFYPDQKEITWDELNSRLGIENEDEKIFECTTLTKLPRRIAEFSRMNLVDAILHNNTGKTIFISLNFVNYVDKDLYKVKDLDTIDNSIKFQEFLEEFFYTDIPNNVIVSLYGTGESNDDVVDLLS